MTHFDINLPMTILLNDMFYRYDLIQIYLMILIIILSWSYCEKSRISNNAYKNNNLARYKSHYKSYLKLLRTKRNIKPKAGYKILFPHRTKVNSPEIENPYTKLKKTDLPNSKDILKINKHKHTRKRSEDDSEDSNIFEKDEAEENVTTPDTRSILIDIFNELQNIKQNSSDFKKRYPCMLNGTWISDILGMAFNITICSDENYSQKKSNCTKNTNMLDINKPIGDVHLNIFEVKPEQKIKYKPILNKSWNISAKIPFSRLTLLVITGEHAPTNSIAIFVGQCQLCDRKELVIGQWIVQKYASECRKVQINQDVFGDVLRRKT